MEGQIVVPRTQLVKGMIFAHHGLELVLALEYKSPGSNTWACEIVHSEDDDDYVRHDYIFTDASHGFTLVGFKYGEMICWNELCGRPSFMPPIVGMVCNNGMTHFEAEPDWDEFIAKQPLKDNIISEEFASIIILDDMFCPGVVIDQKEFEEGVKIATGMTYAQYAKWRYPDCPAEQYQDLMKMHRDFYKVAEKI